MFQADSRQGVWVPTRSAAPCIVLASSRAMETYALRTTAPSVRLSQVAVRSHSNQRRHSIHHFDPVMQLSYKRMTTELLRSFSL